MSECAPAKGTVPQPPPPQQQPQQPQQQQPQQPPPQPHAQQLPPPGLDETATAMAMQQQMPPQMPHVHMTPTLMAPMAPIAAVTSPQLNACKLLVEDARIGRIIGKAGSGLQALRSSSGARLRIEKMLFWGNLRLVLLEGGLEAQQKCANGICQLLAENVAEGGTGELELKALIPSATAGYIVGKSGVGLKELRSFGVQCELRKEEIAVGERLLTLRGQYPLVSAAFGLALAKLRGPNAATAAPM
jgi:hypothetical protein